MPDLLDDVKRQEWFYEFKLPDGSITRSYLPEIARGIHVTREKALRNYLDTIAPSCSTAMDISCHEGYFSLLLAEYFSSVVGLDKNAASLNKARQIMTLLGQANVRLECSSVEDWPDRHGADFILCFGLLYHVENPVEIIRKLAALTGKAICIETQVLPHEVTGVVEDGSYQWQREIQGMFGLCADYSHRAEGGLTDLALVPSRFALEFLLKNAGFRTVKFYQPAANDYEQFTRHHRVVVFAEK